MKPDTHAGADMLGGISLEAALTKEQAEQIYNQGKEAVVFALLELSKKRAEQQSPPTPAPSTPSGMVRDLLIGATCPAGHPYPHSVIGSPVIGHPALFCDRDRVVELQLAPISRFT